VPNEIGQQLRDLTRSRQDYIGRTTEARNQMLKILEGANVKIRSVVSDLNTKTARQIIHALAEGENDVEKLLELCCGSLRNELKMNEMKLALNHLLSPHDREMLKMLEKDLVHNESQIETLDKKIDELSRKHYQRPVEILTTMPGFSKRNAEKFISEVGGNIDRFQSDDSLASYAGLAPGKKQSADVDKPCRRKKGNTYLTTTMVQAAWAAIKVKGSFWQAEFNRLKKRMNSKKAIIAIARKMISVIFAMLKNDAVYQEQGPKRFQKPRVQPSVSPTTTQI
jgi:transposase